MGQWRLRLGEAITKVQRGFRVAVPGGVQHVELTVHAQHETDNNWLVLSRAAPTLSTRRAEKQCLRRCPRRAPALTPILFGSVLPNYSRLGTMVCGTHPAPFGTTYFRLTINRLHLLPVLHPYLNTRSSTLKKENLGRAQTPPARHGCVSVTPPPLFLLASPQLEFEAGRRLRDGDLGGRRSGSAV